VGNALLVVPLRWESPEPGTRATIPAPFVPYQRILEKGPTRPTLESNQEVDQRLRFQIPPEVLPFQVERVQLSIKVNAPWRRVTVSSHGNDQVVELQSVENPLDPIRIDLTGERLPRPDETGGLHFDLKISDSIRGGKDKGQVNQLDEKWKIEYVEMEVVGTRTNP
jgi:hypothetical protein